MKKFSVLIALALLAVAGTGYAVTCAYDNVPAATLLVPYWKVTLNGATDYPIPTGGTDTLVSIVNVSTPGVIAHVTVWNKYSKAVIDFNIPLTGKDTVSFSMRDIMNGHLSPNLPQYNTTLWPDDPCGLINPGATNAIYQPDIGWTSSQFIRFSHPDANSTPMGTDVLRSISQYNLTSVDAIGPVFRPTVWHSLDQSGDYNNWTTSSQTNVLDTDNPQCGWGATDSVYKDALSGYLTIDVVNYCTNFFPDQTDFYTKDAIATAGWGPQAGLTYTPNVLIGDIFYVDSAPNGGNISGDPAVAIEFDYNLAFLGTAAAPARATFFGKFVADKTFGSGPGQCNNETANSPQGCTAYINGYAPTFQFAGDGREPLGDHYGFRYLADSTNSLQSWIQVWRSDYYGGATVNLCAWADPTAKANNGKSGSGFYDSLHQVQVQAYDNDENVYQGQGIPPGPSGPGLNPPTNNYIFLESQRIALTPGIQYGWNPQAFTGGWVDLVLRSSTMGRTGKADGLYNMGWVGVEHSAPGQFVSVGHATSNLNNQNNCIPGALYFPGTNP
jgi:hypothetical protein